MTAPHAPPLVSNSELPLCFVIGAIGKVNSPERRHADWLFRGIIESTIASLPKKYFIKRADHDSSPGSISSSIINDLLHADLVITDFTFHNPNAMYELGIRHCARKPTIHMCRSDFELPFDNLPQRAIFYNIEEFDSFEKAKTDLRRAVLAINEPNFRVDNPVTQADASFIMHNSEDPRERLIASLQDQITNLEVSVSRLITTSSPKAVRETKSKDFLDVAYDVEKEHMMREIAYCIWNNEGRPHGKHDAYWKAAREAVAEGKTPDDFKINRAD